MKEDGKQTLLINDEEMLRILERNNSRIKKDRDKQNKCNEWRKHWVSNNCLNTFDRMAQIILPHP